MRIWDVLCENTHERGKERDTRMMPEHTKLADQRFRDVAVARSFMNHSFVGPTQVRRMIVSVNVDFKGGVKVAHRPLTGGGEHEIFECSIYEVRYSRTFEQTFEVERPAAEEGGEPQVWRLVHGRPTLSGIKVTRPSQPPSAAPVAIPAVSSAPPVPIPAVE